MPTICNSSLTEIVRWSEYNTFSLSVLVLIRNLNVKCLVKSGRIVARENKVSSRDN